MHFDNHSHAIYFPAFFLAKRSDEISVLQAQKIEVAREIAEIKSVQVEFVQHSLLKRKEIKIDKRIELLESQYMPRYLRVKYFARIARVLIIY